VSSPVQSFELTPLGGINDPLRRGSCPSLPLEAVGFGARTRTPWVGLCPSPRPWRLPPYPTTTAL